MRGECLKTKQISSGVVDDHLWFVHVLREGNVRKRNKWIDTFLYILMELEVGSELVRMGNGTSGLRNGTNRLGNGTNGSRKITNINRLGIERMDWEMERLD